MDDVTDSNAIRDLAARYYGAMVAGDRDALHSLFEPRAAIVGNFDGTFQWLDLEDFVAETESLVGQHGREDCSVESLRIDGDIATVAVRCPLSVRGAVDDRPSVGGPDRSGLENCRKNLSRPGNARRSSEWLGSTLTP